jgi:hypothetical protein
MSARGQGRSVATRSRARRQELFAGVAGQDGNVGEADQRSLLAAPESGDFAFDEESRKLQIDSLLTVECEVSPNKLALARSFEWGVVSNIERINTTF